MWVLLAISGSAAYVSYKVYHRFTGTYVQTQRRMITAFISAPPLPAAGSRQAVTGGATVARRQTLERKLHLSTAALGLTAAGALLQPAGVAGALIVVYLDWPVLAEAIQALRQEKRVRPALLHSTVRALALWHGAYFLSAIDVWLYSWLQRRLFEAEERAQQRLNRFFPTASPTVWLQKAEVAVEVATSAIQPDDTVIVLAGDLAPIDGVITQGSALVDPPFVYDPQCAQLCEVGDPVAGASLILTGKLYVRASQSAVQTQVARLAAAVNRAAQTPTTLQQTSVSLANELATPLLGLGALVALAGSPMSAATLMNARFGEGVHWLAPLTVIHFLHLACQERIWIKEGAALEQLSKVDALVLTQAHTHWSVAAIQALRTRGIKAIYGLSPTPLPLSGDTADAFDLDALFIEHEPATQGQWLAELRRRHPHLGIVGDQNTDAALWPYADLTLAFGAFPAPALTTASVQIDGDLHKLCRLIDLGRSLEANLTTSLGLTLFAGFVSLAGALLPGGGIALSVGVEHLVLLAGLYNAIHPVIVPTDGLYTTVRPRWPQPKSSAPTAPRLAALFSPPTLAALAS